MSNPKHDADFRFPFGENWDRFLRVLNEDRIRFAVSSLGEILAGFDLGDRDFFDVGSGSGLSSLAARRLGARVVSFDYDPESVACTLELKKRYFPNDTAWRVEQGSVLDESFLTRLGSFDVVYSWGVLHHTGAMNEAMAKVLIPLRGGGRLAVSLYNNQGWASRLWRLWKRLYNRSPLPVRGCILFLSLLRLWGPTTLKDFLRGRPFQTWRTYGKERGMSPWHDLVDWVGGYPFETASPEDVVAFYAERGLKLIQAKTCGRGRGCNEFLFERR